MKFEEWKKYYDMVRSMDEEINFLAAELLNEEVNRMGITLPSNCLISAELPLYYPYIILGKIAWIERYPECTFYAYIYSSKMVRVYYDGKEVSIVPK